MGLFDFFKSKPTPKPPEKEYFWQKSQDEIETWYKEQKKAGVIFDTDEYKAIMKMIGQNYEKELLEELETLKDVNYYQWMDEVKAKGKVISDKVYAKVKTLTGGNTEKSDWQIEMLERQKMREVRGVEIKRVNNTFANGKILDDDNKIDEAIELYETCVNSEYCIPQLYNRLKILYRQKGDLKNDLRVSEIQLANPRTKYTTKETLRKRIDGLNKKINPSFK